MVMGNPIGVHYIHFRINRDISGHQFTPNNMADQADQLDTPHGHFIFHPHHNIFRSAYFPTESLDIHGRECYYLTLLFVETMLRTSVSCAT